MKERPIIFSGPMVRAILDGSKNQTRRVIKKWPLKNHWYRMATPSECDHYNGYAQEIDRFSTCCPGGMHCPYGKIGDRLWVRECFTGEYNKYSRPTGRYLYRATEKREIVHVDDMERSPWCPSIHMPREASRIMLEVTDVRVQRIREISEDDALYEGICKVCEEPGTVYFDDILTPPETCGGHGGVGCHADIIDNFQTLWDCINFKRGYGWKVNPWVWVVIFRRVNND